MSRCTIANVTQKDDVPVKRHFFRRRKFIDQFGLVYDKYDTYEENQLDSYKTVSLVYQGKSKNIFEAYAIAH